MLILFQTCPNLPYKYIHTYGWWNISHDIVKKTTISVNQIVFLRSNPAEKYFSPLHPYQNKNFCWFIPSKSPFSTSRNHLKCNPILHQLGIPTFATKNRVSRSCSQWSPWKWPKKNSWCTIFSRLWCSSSQNVNVYQRIPSGKLT